MPDVRKFLIVMGLAVTAGNPALAAPQMTLANTYGDWSLMTDNNTPHLFCFVTSEPKSTAPDDVKRDAPRAYISAWPKDGIRAEVSFRMGFRIKKSAQALATISPAGFRLFGSGDRAYVSDSTRELKLVEAMRKGKGTALTVAATSESGPAVTDTYSLNGIGQALQKLQETCF